MGDCCYLRKEKTMTTPTRWLKLGAFAVVSFSLSGLLGLGTIRGYLAKRKVPEKTSSLEVKDDRDDDDRDKREKYLFVWAGNQSRINPDFLAVINFNEHS